MSDSMFERVARALYDQQVERVARALADYARSLPETSRDAPFIYSHRQGLARAAIKALTDALPEHRTDGE